MIPDKTISDRLETLRASTVKTIDSHTEGEPTRLIVDGVPAIPGETMTEKLTFFRNHYDNIRKRLTRQPCGGDILAALITEPAEKDCDFGLIYMDARRYPYLCGHATIGAVTTCIEAGWINVDTGQVVVSVDTPSGIMKARADVKGGRVTSVAIRMVPSFVYQTDAFLDVPGFKTLKVSTVCVGGFFVMVSADQLPFPIDIDHRKPLIDLGMQIIDQANLHLKVEHPHRAEVNTVDVVKFYDASQHDRKTGKSMVIYGEGMMDRSPCGTGTAATLTHLYHSGDIAMNEPFMSMSPLDTRFEARVVDTCRIGDFQGVEVEVSGRAHVTGIHEFVIDPLDPFPEGFLV